MWMSPAAAKLFLPIGKYRADRASAAAHLKENTFMHESRGRLFRTTNLIGEASCAWKSQRILPALRRDSIRNMLSEHQLQNQGARCGFRKEGNRKGVRLKALKAPGRTLEARVGSEAL